MPKQSKRSPKIALAIGAGVTAAAAAAAVGAYFLYGSKGAAKKRRQVKSWMRTAGKELVAQMKKMKRVDQATYKAAVDQLAARYKGLKNIDASEVMAMAQELKGHWQTISRQVKGGLRSGKKRAVHKARRRTRK